MSTPDQTPSDSSPTDDERHAAGMKVRRSVLGDAQVDRAVERTTLFNASFQDWLTRNAWGDVWTRPGLDRRTRSLITVALLAAQGAERELGLHVRAAIRNGLTREEISEVLLHTTLYIGIPAANTAYRIAEETLATLTDEDMPDATDTSR